MDIQELAEKLQKDGLARGKELADGVVADANKKAEEIVASAKAKEKEIIENAQKQAQSLLENGKQSLKMAARDVWLQLQVEISNIFETIIHKHLSSSLQQEQVLQNIIQSLVDSYRKQTGSHQVTLEIPAEASDSFKNWLMQELKAEIKSQQKLKGFCLQDKDGGKIEVTGDSIQEALLPYLSGFVRDLVAQEKKS